MTSFEDKYFLKSSKYFDIIEAIEGLPYLTTEEKHIFSLAPLDSIPNKKFLNDMKKNLLAYFREYIE